MSELPQAKKSLGQHWLEDKKALQDIVAFSGLEAEDTVLEIGPGTGTLTDEILAAGAEVVALEFDEERVPALTRAYKTNDKIRIVQGDIRSFDLSSLPSNYKIVANIPYYLTANLMRKLTDDVHKPASATLLVQKEVAQRLAARPGDLSMLAVFVQFCYEVELGQVVKAELFTPPPKVDSQVVKLTKREKPLFDIDQGSFFKLVKAGFSQKRKKLKSSLNHGLGISKTDAANLLDAAGIDSGVRAQELSLQDWYSLFRVFSKNTQATETNK